MNDYAIVFREFDRYDLSYIQAESFQQARDQFYVKHPKALAIATYENPDNRRMAEILKGIKGK